MEQKATKDNAEVALRPPVMQAATEIAEVEAPQGGPSVQAPCRATPPQPNDEDCVHAVQSRYIMDVYEIDDDWQEVKHALLTHEYHIRYRIKLDSSSLDATLKSLLTDENGFKGEEFQDKVIYHRDCVYFCTEEDLNHAILYLSTVQNLKITKAEKLIYKDE